MPDPLPLPPLSLPALPALRGPRVLLRASRPADIDDRLAHPIDPDEEDGYGSAWRREWDGRRYHTRAHLTADKSLPDPSVFSWAVEYDGHCIGNARLKVDADQHCATYSIGVFVAELRGQGLGREITRLVLAWAFDVLGAHRMQLEVLASNQRAIKCYLSCGFRHEGTRRSAELYPDGWRDFHLMAVLRLEYFNPTAAATAGVDHIDAVGLADDRVGAVLVKPALSRFREIFDLGSTPLQVSFTGWHRYVITADQRVFSIPRTHLWVEPAAREARVLRALDHRLVPALLDYRLDEQISPYPITVTRRLPGQVLQDRQATTTLASLTALLRELGIAIAGWHDSALPDSALPDSALPDSARPDSAPPQSAHVEFAHVEFARRCSADTFGRHARRAARLLGLPLERVDRWLSVVTPLFELPDVLVHGDLHEGQLLVDAAGTLTGIVDWETAGRCHPLKDFDFGEWGFWLFAEFEPDFGQLRRAAWTAYAQARGLAIDWLAPHLFFTVVEIASDEPRSDWQRRRMRNGLALLRAADARVG